jgi:hypothetical protein
MRPWSYSFFLVAWFAGCEFPKPVVNDPDVGPACNTNADCASIAGKTVCDMDERSVCVQCNEVDSSACTGLTPVCMVDKTCRACAQNSECPLSDVCLPDGSCAVEAEVMSDL